MKTKVLYVVVVLALLFSAAGISFAEPTAPISFTILHTNDFHGQLEWKSGGSSSNPGMARVAKVVNDVRTAVGAANVLLVDAGDEMQGSLLSNLQKGKPTIAVYNAMGYNAATFGNHEFDWGQTVLISRTNEALYPYVTANVVVNDTGDCNTAGWTTPAFADPYTVQLVGTAPDQVRVGFIGVTTPETPIITIASATAGLCFKDPLQSILHYYDALKAQADVIVVLSHLGFDDGGYGYGIPVYGDKTLAQRLIDAGKPASLIIGGHSHTDIGGPPAGTPPVTPPAPAVIGGTTTVVQAYYNGRRVGRADLTFDPSTGATTVSWQTLQISSAGVADPTIEALIATYASDPAYVALINTPIGYGQVDLMRDYNGDNMMGDFVDDAIYNALNNDAEPANDVDMFFNNPGGIRTDWCDKEDPPSSGTYIWSSTGCSPSGVWGHDPLLLNYGHMFTILPFGNATVVGSMTGAQILDLVNQSATLFKGAIQPAGMRYSFYRYTDALPGPQPYAWGGFDVCVINRTTSKCDPLDLSRTYKVGTNEFLAPAGGDGFSPFKYMTNVTYWGDMLNAVNAWVTAHYTFAAPYKGPKNNGALDGRIARDGTDAGGSIVPVTILHHNDPHGNLLQSGTYPGLTQLATLVTQERAHNPTRTLFFNAGDTIQGDAMMYYFKSAALGYAADGTPLPPALRIQPMIAAMNAMKYTGMTLGNHEFNFGNSIFTSVLGMANFPILGANVSDDGSYGLDKVPVLPDVQVVLPGPSGVIDVAILGITNHRVPNYELPSNIPGLTFPNPINTAKALVPDLAAANDVVIALTHIGFTTNPSSVEVDNNVDTYLATQVRDIDAIIGAHSHTDPSKQTIYSGDYKYLPAILAAPDGDPVLINQAYRYNNYLGEVVLGLRPVVVEGVVDYRVVTRAGRYVPVCAAISTACPVLTPEDPTIKAIVQPYADLLAAYNNTVLGQTTVPIDALPAFTQETNAANIQADASVWELAQHGVNVDFHLSGAMTNKKIADSATPASPYTLKVSDMFTLMPYENSLVALQMNGPQLKTILERAYRNYYYYKYVPLYGGYSYYTTCMLDTNAGNQIVYRDTYPALPNGNNVVALNVNGQSIDFTDATKFYTVSTVNYLAAGSCNFSDGGVSLWPLSQIVADTQYYVRDAMIHYVTAQGTVSPAIEGRVVFVDNYLFMPLILKGN